MTPIARNPAPPLARLAPSASLGRDLWALAAVLLAAWLFLWSGFALAVFSPPGLPAPVQTSAAPRV
jgi:hypothetical protein